MPVTSQQLEYAKGIVDALSENPRTGEPAYTRMKRIKPKGLRGSILKHIGWPTSWAILYDLSPAQISQNREPEKAREVWGFDSDRLDRVNVWKVLLRGYFYNNPDPMSESAFPSWRKPSWMSEASAQAIRSEITRAYENEGVRQRAEEETPTEAELAQPMPAEETPSQAESNEAPSQAESRGERIGQTFLIAFYRRYNRYFRDNFDARSPAHYIEKLREVERQNQVFSTTLNIYNASRPIRALEQLGFGPANIRNFLSAISSRGLVLKSQLRLPGRSQYGPFGLVELAGRGFSVRRYQRRLSIALIKDLSPELTTDNVERQFNPEGLRRLQTFRFSGQGSAMRGFQAFSLVGLAEGHRAASRYIAQANADAEREFKSALEGTLAERTVSDATQERQAVAAQAASELASEGVLQSGSGGQGDTPVETQVDSPPIYYYLGYGKFPARRAFSTLSPLYYGIDGLSNVDGENRSFAFYFVRPQGGRYDIYRSIFSPMEMMATGLPSLKAYWAASGQLDTPNSIKLKKAGPQEAQRVRQAFLEASNVSRASVSFSRIEIKPERIATDAVGVYFNKIGPSELIIRTLTSQFEEMVGQSTSSTSSSVILTKEQMIDSARVKFENHTFGWELEAYVKEETRTRAADALNRVAPEGALKFKSSTPDTMPVNGGRYGLVNDTSINYPNSQRGETNRKDEGYEDYTVAEFVSPVLEGAKGLDLVKKCCEAMNSAGVRVNSSDGLHVHFDGHGRGTSPTLKAWQMSNMVINYHVLWPVIDRIQNIGRTGRNNGWAKDWPPAKIEEFMRFSDSKSNDYKKLYRDIYQGHPIRTWAIGAAPKYHNSRYRAVNLHGTVTQAGTIEFRQGSPTTDYLYIQNWILFLYHLIEVSKKGYFKKPSSDVDSTSYLRDVWTYCELMLPDDVASFIANETYIIDGESVENNQRSNRTRR